MSDASSLPTGARGIRDLDLAAPLRPAPPRDGEWSSPGQIAPFPAPDLTRAAAGRPDPRDFARHRGDAPRAARPAPLPDCIHAPDFDGELRRGARRLDGFDGRPAGAETARDLLERVTGRLPPVAAQQATPHQPGPMTDRPFDAVISVSGPGHMCEPDHLFHLRALARVARPGATLRLSIHGERALERALCEPEVSETPRIPPLALKLAQTEITHGRGFAFIRREDDPGNGDDNDGLTFILEDYVRSIWSRMFEVLAFHRGARHDFQDVVVLKAR